MIKNKISERKREKKRKKEKRREKKRKMERKEKMKQKKAALRHIQVVLLLLQARTAGLEEWK